MTTKSEKPSSQHAPLWQFDFENDKNTLTLSGNWLTKNDNIPRLSKYDFQKVIPNKPLYFDSTELQQWDSSLIAFLWDVKHQATQHDIEFHYDSLPEAIRKLLGLLSEKTPPTTKHSTRTFRPITELGAWTEQALTNLGSASQMFVEALQGAAATVVGRSYMRLVDLLHDVRNAGPSALIIISIVNLLVGAILAFVGAVQLRRFSADAYVANLVGIATVREMAAIMTAIVMSGRTGGAYAARIATMQGNEEIDALKVMGIPISHYIILPSMFALVFTMPFLYLYGCLMGILGGLIVSIMMLKISIIGFLQQTFGAVDFNQFIFGGVKSITFAMFIGISSCHIGLKAGRSAADVGIAATRAVVAGIVGVIALDAVFAILADIIGI